MATQLDDFAPFRLLGKLTNTDVGALKSLAKGKASSSQQKQALAFIVKNICRTYDVSFRPGKPDVSAFNEGRAFVGKEIVRMVKRPYDEILTQNEEPNNG